MTTSKFTQIKNFLTNERAEILADQIQVWYDRDQMQGKTLHRGNLQKAGMIEYKRLTGRTCVLVNNNYSKQVN